MDSEKVKDLTDKEKSFLQRLFWDYHSKIDKKLNNELLILSKYKGELARNYASVGEQQQVLVSYMKEILENQEAIISIYGTVQNMLIRVESFFLEDCGDGEKVIKEDALIGDLFETGEDWPASFTTLSRRTLNALISENITHLHMLKKLEVRDLAIIPNLGHKAVSLVIYLASKKGIVIPFNGHPFPAIRRSLERWKCENP